MEHSGLSKIEQMEHSDLSEIKLSYPRKSAFLYPRYPRAILIL